MVLKWQMTGFYSVARNGLNLAVFDEDDFPATGARISGKNVRRMFE